MNENECAIAVKDWALTVLGPEVQTGYHFLSAEKGGLPDVMVDVDEKVIAQTHPAFPYAQLQQVDLRVFTVSLLLMVEKGAVPDYEADQDETEQLRSFGQRLEDALLSDATLGDSVPMASPYFTVDYRLPFVQYPDGTRGRQMSVTMYVAEPIESSH